MAEQDPQGQPEKKKGKLKAILIVAAVALLSVGLSVGATLYFIVGDSAGEAEGPVAAGKAGDTVQPAQYFSFDQAFITTVNQADKQRYMQAFVALVYRDAAVGDALAIHEPLLRSRLLTVFGQQDFIALQTGEGREVLRDQALQTVNRVLKNEGLESEGAPPVEQVLFTNFVLQ